MLMVTFNVYFQGTNTPRNTYFTALMDDTLSSPVKKALCTL